MTFIRLYTTTGEEVVINATQISYITETCIDSYYSELYMVGRKKPIEVNARVEQIVDCIDKAEGKSTWQ